MSKDTVTCGEAAELLGVRAREVVNLVYDQFQNQCALVRGKRRIPKSLLHEIRGILAANGKEPKPLPKEK
jgi:hypothetical protein